MALHSAASAVARVGESTVTMAHEGTAASRGAAQLLGTDVSSAPRSSFMLQQCVWGLFLFCFFNLFPHSASGRIKSARVFSAPRLREKRFYFDLLLSEFPLGRAFMYLLLIREVWGVFVIYFFLFFFKKCIVLYPP